MVCTWEPGVLAAFSLVSTVYASPSSSAQVLRRSVETAPKSGHSDFLWKRRTNYRKRPKAVIPRRPSRHATTKSLWLKRMGRLWEKQGQGWQFQAHDQLRSQRHSVCQRKVPVPKALGQRRQSPPTRPRPTSSQGSEQSAGGGLLGSDRGIRTDSGYCSLDSGLDQMSRWGDCRRIWSHPRSLATGRRPDPTSRGLTNSSTSEATSVPFH